jgi:hypothetical protein
LRLAVIGRNGEMGDVELCPDPGLARAVHALDLATRPERRGGPLTVLVPQAALRAPAKGKKHDRRFPVDSLYPPVFISNAKVALSSNCSSVS